MPCESCDSGEMSPRVFMIGCETRKRMTEQIRKLARGHMHAFRSPALDDLIVAEPIVHAIKHHLAYSVEANHLPSGERWSDTDLATDATFAVLDRLPKIIETEILPQLIANNANNYSWTAWAMLHTLVSTRNLDAIADATMARWQAGII